MSPFLSLVAARVHSISPDITYYCSLDVLRLRGYGTPRSPGGPGGNTGQHGMSGGEWGLVLAHAAVALISYATLGRSSSCVLPEIARAICDGREPSELAFRTCRSL